MQRKLKTKLNEGIQDLQKKITPRKKDGTVDKKGESKILRVRHCGNESSGNTQKFPRLTPVETIEYEIL